MGVVASWQSVEHRYGSVRALNGFSLQIEAGQIVGLLGPNGAGKSTAIKLLVGLLRCQQGRVALFDRPPHEREARRALGAMLQVTALPDTLNLIEQLRLFASCYDNPLSPGDALEQVGLADLGERRYAALSGGQQRRAQLALALVGNPRLLVLDEPTTGMDLASRQAFEQTLQRARERGCAVLLASHDLPEVESLADRVALIGGGRVLADDTPAQIRARVGVRRIRCRSTLSAAQLKDWAEVQQVHAENGHLHLLTQQAEALLRRLLAADSQLSDLEVRGADLEQALETLQLDLAQSGEQR